MTALQYSEYYLVTTIHPGFSGVTNIKFHAIAWNFFIAFFETCNTLVISKVAQT